MRLRAKLEDGDLETRGGFLFTHRGYSGPSVLDISHVTSLRQGSGGQARHGPKGDGGLLEPSPPPRLLLSKLTFGSYGGASPPSPKGGRLLLPTATWLHALGMNPIS